MKNEDPLWNHMTHQQTVKLASIANSPMTHTVNKTVMTTL